MESLVRGVLALFVKESDNLSIEELAKFLGREPSGLSKLSRRLEQKCFESPIFTPEIGVIRKSIYL